MSPQGGHVEPDPDAVAPGNECECHQRDGDVADSAGGRHSKHSASRQQNRPHEQPEECALSDEVEAFRPELFVATEDRGGEHERGETRRLDAEDRYDPSGALGQASCPGHSYEGRIASRQQDRLDGDQRL